MTVAAAVVKMVEAKVLIAATVAGNDRCHYTISGVGGCGNCDSIINRR